MFPRSQIHFVRVLLGITHLGQKTSGGSVFIGLTFAFPKDLYKLNDRNFLKEVYMRKLCFGFSFFAIAMLVACGSESGTAVNSELPPGFSERISSNGGNDNDGESSASGNKNSNATEGTSSASSEGNSSGSEGSESAGSDASIYDANANTLTDLRDG